MNTGKSPQIRTLAPSLLQAGIDALDEVQRAGVEMHKNWRIAIYNQVARGPAAASFKKICEEKSQ